MKTACGRNLLLLTASTAIAVLASGCSIDFRNFSMDSTSRMPWFGFELRDRKPKSNVPSYNSISRTDFDSGTIEPAVKTHSIPTKTQSTLTNNVLSRRLKNPFSGKSTDTATAAAKQIDQPPKSIAIPQTITEGAFSPVERKTADASLDFQ